jgi:hypothetical protein
MAHYAVLDNNIVTQVFVGKDEGIGFTYDEERDAFIPPQPYPSWTLNEDTCLWDSPVPYPEEGVHEWDEDNQEWVELWTK